MKDVQANTKRNIRIVGNLLNVLNILNILQIKHIDMYYKTEEKIRLTWHPDNCNLIVLFTSLS